MKTIKFGAYKITGYFLAPEEGVEVSECLEISKGVDWPFGTYNRIVDDVHVVKLPRGLT